MTLHKLAGDCDDVVTCPAVYLDDTIRIDGDDAIVQGAHILDDDTLSQLHLGDGEVAVRLPAKLILDAARHLTEDT
jgi:hypothetical protein